MLTVIIVSWNVCDDLLACLTSLYSAPPKTSGMRVVVVDNASHDGSPDRVAEAYPDVHLVRNTVNRGFTGGNNDGLAAARAWVPEPPGLDDFALLLNPDTVVPPGALDSLLAEARAHPEAGVIGPRLIYGDGSPQSSRRRFPTLATGLFESTWLQRIAPRDVLDRYFARDLPEDAPAEVDWVVGAAMLARWQTIASVGVLDEAAFFMYSEETDWCRRIKAAGWRVRWTPAATIQHHEDRSSRQVSGLRMIRFATSRARYFAKHHGRLQAALVRLNFLTGFAAQMVVESAKWLVGHKRQLRADRIRAYGAALKSGLA